mgnify:CR=1 FL=1
MAPAGMPPPLVRTHNKKPVNPFDDGTALMKLAHGVGVWFSYGTRRDDLMRATNNPLRTSEEV